MSVAFCSFIRVSTSCQCISFWIANTTFFVESFCQWQGSEVSNQSADSQNSWQPGRRRQDRWWFVWQDLWLHAGETERQDSYC